VTPILLVSLTLVPIAIAACHMFARIMRSRSIGQSIREVGPSRHASKAGTPTMGGLVLFALWLGGVGVILIRHPLEGRALLVLAAGSLFLLLGAADDLLGLMHRRSLGLSVAWKMFLSTLFVAILFFAFRTCSVEAVLVPFTGIALELPASAAFFLAWFAFLGTTHGMNLADGLDGLASGLAAIALAGILIIRPTPGNIVLILPLLGALVGFLWVNAHPAGLFLGDTGSYFLGGVIAAVAWVNGLAFLLPLLAGVLVLEAVSVILQVGFRRWMGRRLFRMAPIHHHFEEGTGVRERHIVPAPDWPESKITIRFWILQLVFVAVAVLATRGATW